MLLYAAVQDKDTVLNAFYKLRGAPHGYSRGQLRIAIYNGLRITFPFKEDPAFDDVWIREVYQEYIPRKEHVVIDVGAHMGFFTLKIVNAVSQIIAVEPDPVNFKFLLYNIHSNRLDDKVALINVALGEKRGKIFLDRRAYGYGRSRSTTAKTDCQSEMWTLDDLLCGRGLKKVSLVKIDTEGFELDVLKGSVNTLCEYKPDLIIAAYHFRKEYLLISDFLKKHAYLVFYYCIPLFLFGGKELYLYAKADTRLPENQN